MGRSCRGSSPPFLCFGSANFAFQKERDQHLQTLSDLAGRDSKKASADLDTAHRSRRWTWADLKEVHERKYLFRKVALEVSQCSQPHETSLTLSSL